MKALIQRAKACYQFTKTAVPEGWAQARHPYSQPAAIEAAKASLGRRAAAHSGRLNFIMAVPVVNWETTLMEHARAHGSCHHIAFEARGFFDGEAPWRAWRDANFDRLQAEFEAAYRPDELNILFLYLSEFHIDPARLAGLRRKNVVLVHFNWDDRLHYSSRHKGQSVGVREMAKAADFSLTMAIGPMSRYVGDGAAVFYWWGLDDAPAADPSLPEIEFERVLFFGSKYGYREALIDYLLRKGLPIDVYGSGWGTEFISYERLAYSIPRYALNLGVSTIGYTRSLSCVKGRDIEVPSSGGLYLTNRSREIAQVYIPGEDILTYESMDDCYARASEVLSNPSPFRRVRLNGARKARSFSWDARFRYLVDLVGKLAPVAS